MEETKKWFEFSAYGTVEKQILASGNGDRLLGKVLLQANGEYDTKHATAGLYVPIDLVKDLADAYRKKSQELEQIQELLIQVHKKAQKLEDKAKK